MHRASRFPERPPVARALRELRTRRSHNGIWARSSLLHLPAAEPPAVVAKYARALKPGSTFYLSFKLGTHDGMRDGRWFTDLDEPALRALVAEVPGLRVDRVDITGDVRPGRSNEKWLNAWCVRV